MFIMSSKSHVHDDLTGVSQVSPLYTFTSATLFIQKFKRNVWIRTRVGALCPQWIPNCASGVYSDANCVVVLLWINFFTNLRNSLVLFINIISEAKHVQPQWAQQTWNRRTGVILTANSSSRMPLNSCKHALPPKQKPHHRHRRLHRRLVGCHAVRSTDQEESDKSPVSLSACRLCLCLSHKNFIFTCVGHEAKYWLRWKDDRLPWFLQGRQKYFVTC